MENDAEKRVNWGTIITASLSAVVGLSAVSTFIYNSLYSPAMTVGITSEADNVILITASNTGSAPATNVLITLKSPSKILDPAIFGTENYTIVPQKDDNVFEVSIPRFVQGSGSRIELKVTAANVVNTSLYQIVVYSTYDQGSLKTGIRPGQKTNQTEFPIFGVFVVPVILTIIFGVIMVYWYLWTRFRKVSSDKPLTRWPHFPFGGRKSKK